MLDVKWLEQLRDVNDDPKKIMAAYDRVLMGSITKDGACAQAFINLYDRVCKDYKDNYGTGEGCPPNSIHNVTYDLVKMSALEFYTDELDRLSDASGMRLDNDMRTRLVLATVAGTCEWYANPDERLEAESLYAEILKNEPPEKSLEQQEEDRMNIGASVEDLNRRGAEIENAGIDRRGHSDHKTDGRGPSGYNKTYQENKTAEKGPDTMNNADEYKMAMERIFAAGDDPEKIMKEYEALYGICKDKKDAESKAFMGFFDTMHEEYVQNYGTATQQPPNSIHDVTYNDAKMHAEEFYNDHLDKLDKVFGMSTDVEKRAKLIMATAAFTCADYQNPGESLMPKGLYEEILKNEPPQKSAEQQAEDELNAGADPDDLNSRAPDAQEQKDNQGQDNDGKPDTDKDAKKKKKKKDDEEAEAAAAEEQERQKDRSEDGEGKEKQKKSRFTTEEWAEMAEIANGIVPDAYLRQAQVVERILYHIGKENYTYKSLTNVSEYLTDKKRATMAGRRLARDFNAIQKEHAKLAREALELNNALYGTVLGKVKDHYKDQLQADGEAENGKKAVDGARPQKGLFGGLPEKIKKAANGKGKQEPEQTVNEAADDVDNGQATEGKSERKSPVRFADMKIAVPFLMLKGVPGKIRSKLDEAIDKNKEKKKTVEDCREGYGEAMADVQDPVSDAKGFRKLLGSIKGVYDKAMAKWRDRNDVNKYDLQDEDDKDKQTGAGKDSDDVNSYDDEDTAADDVQAGNTHGDSPEDPDSYDDLSAGDEYYVPVEEFDDEFDYSQFEGQEWEDDEDEGQEPENEAGREAADVADTAVHAGNGSVVGQAGMSDDIVVVHHEDAPEVQAEPGKDMAAAQVAGGNLVQASAGDVPNAELSGDSTVNDDGNGRSDAATISDLLSGMPTEPPLVLSKDGPQAGDASKEDVQADAQDTGADAAGVTAEELGEKLKEAGEAVPFDAGPVRRSTLAANLIADAENKEAANKEAERLLHQMGNGDGLEV